MDLPAAPQSPAVQAKHNTLARPSNGWTHTHLVKGIREPNRESAPSVWTKHTHTHGRIRNIINYVCAQPQVLVQDSSDFALITNLRCFAKILTVSIGILKLRPGELSAEPADAHAIQAQKWYISIPLRTQLIHCNLQR